MKKKYNLKEISDNLLEKGYKLIEALGIGGFSIVLKVYSNFYEKIFVAKVEKISDDQSFIIYEEELRALMDLDHPNVVSLYDHFLIKNYFFLILEYCENGSFQDYLNKNGKLSENLLCRASFELCHALHHCHERNIAHRDIKPSNLLIDQYGRLKLADFGLCKRIVGNHPTRYFCGSLPYLAPELFQTNSRVDPKIADVWSLGITLYHLAFGQVPFYALTKEKFQKILSQEFIPFLENNINNKFNNFIQKVLIFNPINRPKMFEIIQFPEVKGISNSNSSINNIFLNNNNEKIKTKKVFPLQESKRVSYRKYFIINNSKRISLNHLNSKYSNKFVIKPITIH